MINRKALYLIVILAIALGLYLWDQKPTDVSPNISSTKIEAPKEETTQPVAKPNPEVSSMISSRPAQPAENPNSPIEKLVFPQLTALREEVKKDPHSTPPVLLKFADQMATAMDEAKKGESEGTALFKKLQTCIAQDAPIAARGLCLENAKRLSKMYPSLEGPFSELMKSTPKNVIQLMDQGAD